MLVEFRDREFVKSTIVITHDLSILYQIADTILVMYAGKLVEKGSAGELTSRPAAPLYEAPHRFAPGGRRADLGEAPAAASQAGRRRCSTRRPAAGSGTGARSRSRSAQRSRRSSRSRPVGSPRAGRRRPDAASSRTSRKVFKTGTFGGAAVTAVSDVSVRHPARRDRVADRRERERQDDGREDDPAADDRDRRLDHVRRAGRRDARRRRAPRLLRPRAGRLPGSVQLVQPGLQGRPRVRDGAQHLSPGADRRRVEHEEAAGARGRRARAGGRPRQVSRTS